jgi:hypothetical protein
MKTRLPSKGSKIILLDCAPDFGYTVSEALVIYK